MSSKQILFLSIFTFLTVLAWIGFDVYHAVTTSTISPIQRELIKPLDPKFDTAIISKLKEESQK
ncbi:MAG: hypothetical protein M1575_04285 [Patescibacteria group bacterium]|nr:hypothetical protein [Patescibacteria group bacterium]